jgi:hypothetical protein
MALMAQTFLVAVVVVETFLMEIQLALVALVVLA